MDLLSNRQARRAILDYYQASGEPQAVQEAIRVSEIQAMSTFTLERMKHENTGYVHIPPPPLSCGEARYEKLRDARGKNLIQTPKIKETNLRMARTIYLSPVRYRLKRNKFNCQPLFKKGDRVSRTDLRERQKSKVKTCFFNFHFLESVHPKW